MGRKTPDGLTVTIFLTVMPWVVSGLLLLLVILWILFAISCRGDDFP